MKKFCLITVLTAFTIGSAFSAKTKNESMKEPTKEMRQKMSEIHEQMSTCLKSDKNFSDCRTQMRSGCQTMMGDDGCMYMGKMMNNKHKKNKGKMMR